MDENLKENSILSHYRIVSKIGKGGMGEVYLAEDTKLDRQVALKILPAEFAEDKDRMSRFVREAKSASALNHPNIITIYEINKIGDLNFIATEFIDGKTLDKYAKDNRLSFSKVLDIAIQVASALDEAHQAGIVHRDIKPDNIMVRSNGLVKILDFGIAKLTENQDVEIESEDKTAIQSGTTPGMIIGTANYMSPEQARGQMVDARTDIFSFGVVFYEMLSGKSLFAGETVSDTLAAVLTKEPSPLENIPAGLEAIIQKTLRKDKRERYQTAENLLDDLKEFKRDLEIQSHLERTSSPDLEEQKTQMLPTPATAEKSTVSTTGSEEGFRVAVLPFKYRGGNDEIEALAEGLSEEIVTGLSRFPYLRVISRSASLSGEIDTGERRTSDEEFGIRYVLEGSLRKVGTTVRVAVQLVDTATGEHLWAETYDRKLEAERIFEIQDELVSRVVSTIADWHGVLVHSMAGSLRSKDKKEITPDEAVLYVFGYIERLSPEEHLAARDLMERIVKEFPDKGNCWAMLAILYCNEYMYGFNLRPDPLGRALAAAQRAVELEPANYLASQSLAFAYFFRREFAAFETMATRTLALNRMCGGTVAILGVFFACSGEWERGCQLSREAMELNPHFPGWYRLPFIFNAYRLKNYREVINEAQNINIPNYFWTLVMRTAALGQLGESEKAKEALGELLASRPDIAGKTPDEFGHWLDAEFVEDLMEGLRKAGFETDSETNQKEQKTQIIESNATAKENTNSIAVLPFTNMSADEDNEYFCDGLAEELLNVLSKIEDLRVAARTSAFSFKGKNTYVSEIGEKLSVENILEGSVRKSGDKIRISVQLVNASDGYQLWSERYDREMKDIFDVQDEIALAVVDALKLKIFDKQNVARKYEPKLPAYEAFLKGRYKYYKFSPETFAEAEEYFKEAIDLDRNWADPISALSDVYFNLGFYGWQPFDEMISLAQKAARKALELDSSQSMAHSVLGAVAGLHDYDWEEAENHFRSSNVSESQEPNVHYYHGMFYLLPLGKFDEAKSEMDAAGSSDPLNIMWHARKAWIHFCSGEYETAITQANRSLEMDDTDYQALMMTALSYCFQGKLSEAKDFSERVFELAPWDSLGTGLLAGILARVGENDRAKKILSEMSGAVTFGTMIYHLICGEIDEAIDWFEKDLDLRRPNAPMVANAEFCRPLRNHPRWTGLTKRMNLPETDSASIPDKQTDETLEAKTGIIQPNTAEENAKAESISKTENNPKSKIQNPKSLWLFGLLGLIFLTVGFFGYNYFAPGSNQIESIAVMPFVNESGNEDIEYLSDGMTETLISNLSNLPNLNVKPRSSVFRYKGEETDPQTIAKELNVQAILNGRVVQRGQDISLFIELMDISLNKVIWSETYNRKQSDLVTLQTEIARDVSIKLKTKLSSTDEAKVTKTYTANAEAYQLYLKGNYHFAKKTKDDMLKGIEYFQQAIRLDPNFALAYVGIADSYNSITSFDYLSPKESVPKAKRAAQRALEIDPTLAEAHTALATSIVEYDWDWEKAEQGFKRALELNPNAANTHFLYGIIYLVAMGHTREAIVEIKRAAELEPLNVDIGANLAAAYMYDRQYDRALEQALKINDLDPNFVGGRIWLATMYAINKKYAEAIAICEKGLLDDPTNSPFLTIAGYSYAKNGQRQKAEQIINRLKEIEKTHYISHFWVAVVYGELGKRDEAFAELEKAYQERDYFMPRLKVEPFIDSLRDDPRFKELVKKLNLPD